MTPFKVVFGRALPSLTDYLTGTSSVATIDELLRECTDLIMALRENLSRAQHWMRNQVNSRRTDVKFQSGDWVWLKLQPYR